MRTTLRLLPLLLPLLLVAAPTAPAAAAATRPVGGAALGSAGIVVGASTTAVPATTAASYVVADLDTGDVLAAKDPHGAYAPASTLKTLTALTLIPRLDPAAMATPAAEDVNVDGSKVGLVVQLSYSVHDLFNALLITSANDAAGTLATAVGGQAAATALMNAEAARLQARDTHAVNTSGLDAAGQVSSAYDLALIARAAMALPDFRAYVATRRATVPAPDGRTIEIDTHNRLLGRYEGAIGIKNGFTEAARASFVAAATRGGHTVLVTLMRGDPTVYKDAELLLDWGFGAQAQGVRPVGELVGPVQPDRPGIDPPSAGPSAAVSASRPVAVAPTTPDGGLPYRPVVVGVGVAAGAVLLRRRQVVRRRAQRRTRSRSVRRV